MTYRILLCDDDRDSYSCVRIAVDILCEAHPSLDISLVWASTEEEGGAEIGCGVWDLILCDVLYGDEERGLALIQSARRKRGDSETRPPILGFTQFHSDQTIVVRAREAGADDVIAKYRPSPSRLAESLAEYLNIPEPGGESQGTMALARLLARLFQRVPRFWMKVGGYRAGASVPL